MTEELLVECTPQDEAVLETGPITVGKEAREEGQRRQGAEGKQEGRTEKRGLWSRLDERIRWRKAHATDSSRLYVLEVPTFKPFTSVLEGMARHLPGARVLEISKNATVQVSDVCSLMPTQAKSPSPPSPLSPLSVYSLIIQYPALLL